MLRWAEASAQAGFPTEGLRISLKFVHAVLGHILGGLGQLLEVDEGR
jgi:hypothetical protein